MTKRKVYTIVLVGESHVGKTCLANKLCYGSIPTDYEPTIEDSYTTIVLAEKVEIIDTSSDDTAKVIRKASLKIADAVMLVYDSQNHESLDKLFYYVEELRSAHAWMSLPHLPTVCLVVGVAKHAGPIDNALAEEGKRFAHLCEIEHINVRLNNVSVRMAFERCLLMIDERRHYISNQTMNHGDKTKCCVIL